MSTLHERLFSKCVWTDDGCLVFTGARTLNGHGRIRGGEGKLIYTHRAAYLLCVGDVPEGMLVLHKRHCTSPACCLPEHLYIGTSQENTADMMALGRHVPFRVLTTDRVQDARRMLLKGMSLSKVARRLGVATATIGDISCGRTWGHLPWPDPDEVPKLPWHKPTIRDITHEYYAPAFALQHNL